MMYTFAAVAIFVFLLLLAVQVYRIIVGYRRATGTRWQRFLAAFSHSHTIFVARLGSFVAAGLAALQSWLPTLDPTTPIGAAMSAILAPAYTPYYLFAFAVLVEVMRRQQSSVDPILPPPQSVTIPPAPVVVVPTPELYPAGDVVPAPAPGSIVDTHV